MHHETPSSLRQTLWSGEQSQSLADEDYWTIKLEAQTIRCPDCDRWRDPQFHGLDSVIVPVCEDDWFGIEKTGWLIVRSTAVIIVLKPPTFNAGMFNSSSIFYTFCRCRRGHGSFLPIFSFPLKAINNADQLLKFRIEIISLWSFSFCS